MLKSLSIAEFMDRLSSKNAPLGGGSAAALTGLLAVGLLKMAVNHSLANPALNERREFFKDNLTRLEYLSSELAGLMDKDAEVLAELFEVFAAEAADETDSARQNKIAASLETAAKVPLQTAAAGLEVLEIARSIAAIVEDNLKSEVMTAVNCGHAGATGALMSTAVNLSYLKDENLVADLEKEIQSVTFKADELKKKTENLIFRQYPFSVLLHKNNCI